MQFYEPPISESNTYSIKMGLYVHNVIKQTSYNLLLYRYIYIYLFRTTVNMDEWMPHFVDTYDPLMAGSIDGTDTVPHDKGIYRAMQAKYKPNLSITGEVTKIALERK